MRFSRPLCFFLTLLIFFSFLLVPSSAATNLINPYLNQWENVTSIRPNTNYLSPTGEMYVRASNLGNDEFLYLLQGSYIGTVNDVSLWMGIEFDQVSLVSGHSYTFSFDIPSFDYIREHSDYSWSDHDFASRVGNGYLFGFGVVDPSGDIQIIQEFITFTSENIMSWQGKTYVNSFTCPDYSGGNPCIVIMSVDSSQWNSTSLFLTNNIFLVDNEEEEEEGFLNGLFEWFQKRFDELKTSFSNLTSSIGGFFTSLGDRISGFFTSLGDRISDFFTGLYDSIDGLFNGLFTKLGNLILYLTWDDVAPENPFESDTGILVSIDEFIQKIVDYLSEASQNLNALVDSATSGIYIFDVLTERFPWIRSLCAFTLVLIVFTRFIGL